MVMSHHVETGNLKIELGPLEEQLVILTIELPLQPFLEILLRLVGICEMAQCLKVLATESDDPNSSLGPAW